MDRIIDLPPNYSEADEKRRMELLCQVEAIRRDAQLQCEPIFNELAQIEARYLRRFAIVPA